MVKYDVYSRTYYTDKEKVFRKAKSFNSKDKAEEYLKRLIRRKMKTPSFRQDKSLGRSLGFIKKVNRSMK